MESEHWEGQPEVEAWPWRPVRCFWEMVTPRNPGPPPVALRGEIGVDELESLPSVHRPSP